MVTYIPTYKVLFALTHEFTACSRRSRLEMRYQQLLGKGTSYHSNKTITTWNTNSQENRLPFLMNHGTMYTTATCLVPASGLLIFKFQHLQRSMEMEPWSPAKSPPSPVFILAPLLVRLFSTTRNLGRFDEFIKHSLELLFAGHLSGSPVRQSVYVGLWKEGGQRELTTLALNARRRCSPPI